MPGSSDSSLPGFGQQAIPMPANGDEVGHQECTYHCRPAPRLEIRLQPGTVRNPLQYQGKQGSSCERKPVCHRTVTFPTLVAVEFNRVACCVEECHAYTHEDGGFPRISARQKSGDTQRKPSPEGSQDPVTHSHHQGEDC